jgi:hypothetical protein
MVVGSITTCAIGYNVRLDFSTFSWICVDDILDMQINKCNVISGYEYQFNQFAGVVVFNAILNNISVTCISIPVLTYGLEILLPSRTELQTLEIFYR